MVKLIFVWRQTFIEGPSDRTARRFRNLPKNTMGKAETPRLESRALKVMLSFNLFYQLWCDPNKLYSA